MKIIYIDLDGVLANFEKARQENPLSKQSPYIGRPDRLPDIYKDLEPIENALESVIKLLEHPKFEVFILSSAPWDNPDAWTHKRLWVEKYLGKPIRNRLILSKRKDLMIGDILIDDSPHNGSKDFKGKWIHYGSVQYPNWSHVMQYLMALE